VRLRPHAKTHLLDNRQKDSAPSVEVERIGEVSELDGMSLISASFINGGVIGLQFDLSGHSRNFWKLPGLGLWLAP